MNYNLVTGGLSSLAELCIITHLAKQTHMFGTVANGTLLGCKYKIESQHFGVLLKLLAWN